MVTKLSYPAKENSTVLKVNEIIDALNDGSSFVTSVNNVAPVSGNVTLSIPTVTDTYSSTSSDGMSGKAVASALSNSGFITGITSSDVTTALNYTPADNTLSNVSSIDANSAVQTALDSKIEYAFVIVDHTS